MTQQGKKKKKKKEDCARNAKASSSEEERTAGSKGKVPRINTLTAAMERHLQLAASLPPLTGMKHAAGGVVHAAERTR